MNVLSDFRWNLAIREYVIESADDPLGTLPQELSSVANVVKVIKALESLQFCVGNEGNRFDSVIAARKGEFMDSTGNNYFASVL